MNLKPPQIMNPIEEVNYTLRTICYQCKHHEKPSGICQMQNNGMVGKVRKRWECPAFRAKYVTWVTTEPAPPPVIRYQEGHPIHPTPFKLHVAIKLNPYVNVKKAPGYLIEVTKGEHQGFYWFDHDWIELGHIELVTLQKS